MREVREVRYQRWRASRLMCSGATLVGSGLENGVRTVVPAHVLAVGRTASYCREREADHGEHEDTTAFARQTLRRMRYWPYAVYAVLYTSLLAALHVWEGFGLAEPLLIMATVGVGFTAFAYWTTRGLESRHVPVHAPRPEGQAVVAYLIPVAIFITWGLPAVRGLGGGAVPTEVMILVTKVSVFVGLPLLLWSRWWGYRIADFVDLPRGLTGHWRPLVWMSLAVILLQLAFGRARSELSTLAPSALTLSIALLGTFVWLLFEVGVVEEFFFRGLLQCRLAAWARSDAVGLVGMALLFGLAHAPGLYLRPELTGEPVGTQPSLLLAIGYAVVATSVTGFFLGVLWLRTRNLILLAIVHAANDLLPSLADTIRFWWSRA